MKGVARGVDSGVALGVGGGVARSTDAGRQWEIVTVAPGRANLGMRGGVLNPQSYWLAGTALWWTDDGGEHWTASPLPWELVAVLARRRWIGLPIGMMLHLALDGIWARAEVFWWPFFGVGFAAEQIPELTRGIGGPLVLELMEPLLHRGRRARVG